MREEFENLYITNRRKGLSRDEAYEAAYAEIRSKYDETEIDRELEGRQNLSLIGGRNVKTVTLTKSEIETIEVYLWSNPCTAGCVYGYKRISCEDVDKNGNYKCKLRRDTLNLMKKLL